MHDINWDKVPRRGGVYCMYDLDDRPVYVGYVSNSRGLRKKIRSDFTQQKSTVVAHARIDLLDIWYMKIWTTDEQEKVAKQLISVLNPVFNRQESVPKNHIVDPDSPNVKLHIHSRREYEIKSRPENRIRTKMTHIQRMVNSEKVAFKALTQGEKQRREAAKEAAEYHLSILESEIEKYFNMD